MGSTWILILGLAALGLLLFGCSTVNVKRLSAGDVTSQGVRFWRSAPYVLVSDGKASVVYLPDRSEEYAITQSWGLGNRKLEVNLEGGWNLTKLGADQGAVPDKALDLLGKVMLDKPTLQGPPPAKPFRLYRLEFDERGKVSKVEEVEVPELLSIAPAKSPGSQ